ncbi:Alpha-L-arabinofuranosidase B (ABFB) domain-containing protein [Streptomyces sp. 1222.2]|uniref:glycoside hydrolase family 43 protein n=1 Tax=Streptomyces sp. 1222.2 TaxID=1938833 RepID=UPI000BD9D6CC|nr:glycoside hydrolase family 43 protein [Streptomyces sp. 1222.2]SOD76034.1 Alpha-L-arabinofuranosidase B (ABFB) domain-containing protein [Streptomyces sp. 1222.2]
MSGMTSGRGLSRRMFLGTAATVPLAATGVLTLGAGTAHAADSAYAMVYFTESNTMLEADYGLHLAVSQDGLNWTPLNQNAPLVTPTQGAGGLRDPFLMRKQDGTFVVLATDLKGTDWNYNSTYIHVWDSTDLRTFTGYRRVKLHDMTGTHSWAPEAYWDASRGRYGILYSSVNSSGHNVIMVSYTTDFVTTSDPQVFFDPGYDIIDGNLTVGVNGVNYLYYKVNQTLVGARSTTLNPGSFTPFSTAASHGGTEAPTVVKSLTSNSWYLWGDTYTPNGVFYAWQSSDLAAGTWTALDQKLYTQPLNSKHCGIHPITSTEYSNLLTKWGAPAWNRLKSYNFPARYIRHSNYVGRIDEYPFDPFTDSQWKLVPGLADSSGVSFQSVSHPTRYLRHYSYNLRLDVNDGTSTFAADATFTRVAGLADSTWSSFRSYNNPTRYIRHSNYVLRIDPISTATEKADATFRVGY